MNGYKLAAGVGGEGELNLKPVLVKVDKEPIYMQNPSKTCEFTPSPLGLGKE